MLPLCATKPISRVLYLTVICLGPALPQGLKPPFWECRAGLTPKSVLLRIGFAGPRSRLRAGELLPRLSTLTSQSWRYISVALSLESPPAAVSRYPCPMELGLSSRAVKARATVWFTRTEYCNV